MSALLNADEVARLVLGVNVIVRAGDPNDGPIPPFDGSRERTREPFVAPQDWVALTGACPQPSAAYAMTICSRCGHMRLSWDSPCHCPVTVPMVSWIGSCDWGSCNQPTARWRFDDDAGWLPVCAEHGRRIVPLYTECRECDGHGLITIMVDIGTVRHIDMSDCTQCDHGRVLVGRGSIEVVPVLDREQLLCSGATVWPPFITVHESLGIVRYWPDSHEIWESTELTLDPLPVPGRDFGIILDCVEVAP